MRRSSERVFEIQGITEYYGGQSVGAEGISDGTYSDIHYLGERSKIWSFTPSIPLALVLHEHHYLAETMW